MADVIPATSYELVIDRYEKAIRTGKPVHWDEVSRYPSGLKYGLVTVVPLYTIGGDCTELVGWVHDVTACVTRAKQRGVA